MKKPSEDAHRNRSGGIDRDAIRARIRADMDATGAEEDASIVAAALDDPDNLPNRDLKRRGRPPAAVVKVKVPLRLDPDVVAHFRATGDGWQTRMNAALRKVAGLDVK